MLLVKAKAEAKQSTAGNLKKGKRKKSAFSKKTQSGEKEESVNLVNARSQALCEGLIELEDAKNYLDHVLSSLVQKACKSGWCADSPA